MLQDFSLQLLVQVGITEEFDKLEESGALPVGSVRLAHRSLQKLFEEVKIGNGAVAEGAQQVEEQLDFVRVLLEVVQQNFGQLALFFALGYRQSGRFLLFVASGAPGFRQSCNQLRLSRNPLIVFADEDTQHPHHHLERMRLVHDAISRQSTNDEVDQAICVAQNSVAERFAVGMADEVFQETVPILVSDYFITEQQVDRLSGISKQEFHLFHNHRIVK